MQCRNPGLPGPTITKEYESIFEGAVLIKRIAVSSSVTGKTLFAVKSDTVFDPEFRSASLCHRMMSAGAGSGSDPRTSIPATQIVGDIIQRGGNNKVCSGAQFVLANLKTGSGLAQYLYKMNDEYVWVPYGMPSSYWNAHGWMMSGVGTFLDKNHSASKSATTCSTATRSSLAPLS